MSAIEAILLALVFIVVIAVLALAYLRAKKPHSRKKAAEQRQIDRRTRTATDAGRPPTEEGPEKKGGKLVDWFSLSMLSILLTIVAVLILYFGIITSSWGTPSFTDVSSWSWSRWLWLLALWGVVATLIAILVENVKVAKTLQWVLVGVMAMIFVIAPVGGWIASFSSSSAAASRPTAGAPAASREVARTPLPQDTPNLPWVNPQNPEDTTNWRKIVVPAHSNSEFVPGVVGAHHRWAGIGIVPHYVYRGGPKEGCTHNCPDGEVLGSYVNNTTAYPVIASFAYEKQKR